MIRFWARAADDDIGNVVSLLRAFAAFLQQSIERLPAKETCYAIAPRSTGQTASILLSLSACGSSTYGAVCSPGWNPEPLSRAVASTLEASTVVLLSSQRHDGNLAGILFILQHDDCQSGLFPHAWSRRLSILTGLCAVHLPPNQERLNTR